jgi:outer membrane protein insertion porin family
VKWRNLFGYAETVDATGCYGWDTTSELSAGVTYPRFNGLHSSLVSRGTILTQDWQKYSSYRENLKGFTIGLIKENSHDLSYNLTWRELEDPSHQASHSVRRQLGHHLVSALKYQYKIDERDSPIRPTQGYAFTSSSQLAGLGPDDRLLRFARQVLILLNALYWSP